MRFTIDTLSASYYSLIIGLSFGLFLLGFIGRNRDDLIIHHAFRAFNIFILAIGQMIILPDLSLFSILSVAETSYLIFLIFGDFIDKNHKKQNTYSVLTIALSVFYLSLIANPEISDFIYAPSNSQFSLITIIVTIVVLCFALFRKWQQNALVAVSSNALALLSLLYIKDINAFLLTAFFKTIFYGTFTYIAWKRIERYYLIQYNKDKAREVKIYQNISDRHKQMAQEFKKENSSLAIANRIDESTGALNKKGLYEKLDLLINDEEIEYFSIIVFDIDKFKYINDNFGHLVGDECLQLLAKQSKNTIRATDFLGRFGGDEFIIMLPRAKREIAADLSERLRKKIEKSTDPHFTISLGIASFPEDGTNKERLIEVADSGLYYSKENGRNRTSYALPK